MYTKQEIIIRSYRAGHSRRRIARDLHISRKTVRKYLDEHSSVIVKSRHILRIYLKSRFTGHLQLAQS